uniref:Si:dkey-16i5.8 n=1 Tax=Oncorhynchus kisutch TaxID=8019 RepID=A0A8C7D4B0_ONCKI
MAQIQERLVEVAERRYQGVGRCKCAFWFAVSHDVVGVFILLTGVFADIFCHDLFIYAGAVIIFLSLIWWVFWFSGNIEVPPEELEDDVGLVKLKNKGISGVVRKVSNHQSLSHAQDTAGAKRNSEMLTCKLSSTVQYKYKNQYILSVQNIYIKNSCSFTYLVYDPLLMLLVKSTSISVDEGEETG